MAGIYTVFEKEGIHLPGFVILTTAANSSVLPIHNRMPVVMEKQEQVLWLKDETFARQVIEREGPQLEALLMA
jgi:putative SOS response-associated peptidase YedK